MPRRTALVGALILGGSLAVAQIAAARADTAPSFTSVQISPGGFEPRIAVGPDGTRWDSTQDVNPSGTTDLIGGGAEVVYASRDGGITWQRTPADPQVSNPCCDNEIAVSPTGRVLTSVIDFSTININIQYSDDGGKTWTQSNGNSAADQDREWLAVGTKDPITGMNDVYMLWHNLASGAADHEMMVSTSRDNGATFGPPVPITTPGSQAWLDLQCADSGGPSNIFTNPTTGQVYAVFGTRSSALGGCGASVTGPFEINIVAATRTWVATSSDQGVTWNDSLAVDDTASGQIVGMQVNAGTVDNAGNVYLVYPESPNAYPNYDGAAVKYREAPPDLSTWSAPVTVSAAGLPGHILTHIAACDPGKLAFFYLTGQGTGENALWYPTVAETQDGVNFTEQQVSTIPAWKGSATSLMGVCNPFGSRLSQAGVLDGAANGLVCGRSSDVLGQAIDAQCNPMFTWADDTSATTVDKAGTYVVTQTGGPSLCAGPIASAPEAPVPGLLVLAGLVGLPATLYWRRRRRAAAA
jgi:BNR repeat-like domain